MIRLVVWWVTRIAIDKNCSWCGGSGYWEGKPCIKCNFGG